MFKTFIQFINEDFNSNDAITFKMTINKKPIVVFHENIKGNFNIIRYLKSFNKYEVKNMMKAHKTNYYRGALFITKTKNTNIFIWEGDTLHYPVFERIKNRINSFNIPNNNYLMYYQNTVYNYGFDNIICIPFAFNDNTFMGDSFGKNDWVEINNLFAVKDLLKIDDNMWNTLLNSNWENFPRSFSYSF